IPHEEGPDRVEVSRAEVTYLCGVVNRWFERQIGPEDVLYSFSGVRPLYDDSRENPSAVTRDYVFDLEAGEGAPLLSIFGGKITTYRKLAEAALQ
ncbi:hypothetical protein JYB64_26400, partial [Algoriphagus aestuarii]|nr:hypothetical protein [Algoriphagus aestuarii]